MERTKKITQSINIIEKRDNLFQKPEGGPIWDYIRFELWSRLLRNDSNGDLKDVEEKKIDRDYTGILRNTIKNTLFHNPLLLGPNNILFHGFSRRSTREDGLNWALHCDPIIEAIDTSWCFLEGPNLYLSYQESGNLHDTPPKTADIRYTDFFELVIPTLKKLGFTGTVADTLCEELPRGIYNAINEVSKKFDVEVDEKELVKSLMLSRKVEKWFYKKVLNQVQPSVVFIVNRSQKLSLIEVCNKLNIPTIGFQQGAIYESHIGISYSIEHPVPSMTDYIFTFGEFWNEMIDAPVPEENIRPVGWPHFEQGLQNASDSTSRHTILIISQPNIGDVLADFAVSLSELISNYQIIFKPHPNTSSLVFNKYPQLKESDVSISQNQELYDLFSKCDIQIGRTSTALFEGIGFGLETYVVQGPNYEHINKLIDSGFAKEVADPIEVHQHIMNNSIDVERFDIDRVFKPNSLENITAELNAIIRSE